MTKSKRSSLKADPLYLKAFRVRASSDAAPKPIEVIPSVDGASKDIEASPVPDRATIKLVEPSPPQSSASTIASRSVSAESQLPDSNMGRPATNSLAEQQRKDSRKQNGTPSKETNTHNSAPKPLPIYDSFTPSRKSTDYEPQTPSRIGSPTLSPSATFTKRAASPVSGSDDGNHWPSHLRSSGSMGKSGRVIERITSENSRLQRELNEKTARLEEAQRTHETDRIAIQEAKESAMRHQHMYETNEAVLIRRDRKVEELKQALNQEKIRREKAEHERQEMAQVLRIEMSNTSKQLASEQEKRLHYQTQYDILEQAYKRGRMPWQPQVDKIQREMNKVADNLHKLAVNQDNISTHQAKADAIHDEMVTKFEEYKKTKNDLYGPVATRIKQNEDAADKLLEEMEAALHKMRWVMAVKRDVKDAQ